ncbi:hypothetical protein TNCV_2243451 [Trichonephila clavipes]|nr:hypothetical protein TNCV_2243451 [Trichonephila clavipes]
MYAIKNIKFPGRNAQSPNFFVAGSYTPETTLKTLNCVFRTRVATLKRTLLVLWEYSSEATRTVKPVDPCPQISMISAAFGNETLRFSGLIGIDEAHFWLNGYVNKQNCRIWSEANPQVYVETPLHPEKLTIWCALWAGGILLQKQ